MTVRTAKLFDQLRRLAIMTTAVLTTVINTANTSAQTLIWTDASQTIQRLNLLDGSHVEDIIRSDGWMVTISR